MANDPRVLPLVARIRDQIDQVFARYVGPIAPELGREEFDHWRAEGQVGPTALHRYISRLSRYIDDEPSRRAFIGDATKCIHASGGTKG